MNKIRIIKVKKTTGCIQEAIVFSNGKTVSCWQTDVPEIAIYDTPEQYLAVRTPERGYTIIRTQEVDIIPEETRLAINKMLEPTGLSIGTISDSTGVLEYTLCGEDGDEIPLVEFGEELHRNFVKDDSTIPDDLKDKLLTLKEFVDKLEPLIRADERAKILKELKEESKQ